MACNPRLLPGVLFYKVVAVKCDALGGSSIIVVPSSAARRYRHNTFNWLLQTRSKTGP
jgi:hypothetical protein